MADDNRLRPWAEALQPDAFVVYSLTDWESTNLWCLIYNNSYRYN